MAALLMTQYAKCLPVADILYLILRQFPSASRAALFLAVLRIHGCPGQFLDGEPFIDQNILQMQLIP